MKVFYGHLAGAEALSSFLFLVVPGAVNGGILSVISTFLLVPALWLVRAYRVRSWRRWLIGAVLTALAVLAAAVRRSWTAGGYAWLAIVVVA